MESFGLPGLGLDPSIQTKRAVLLVSSMGVLVKGHIGIQVLEAGETVDHKGCWESPDRHLYVLVTWRLPSRTCTCMGGLVAG